MGFQSMPYTQPMKGKPLSCDTISDIAGDEPFKPVAWCCCSLSSLEDGVRRCGVVALVRANMDTCLSEQGSRSKWREDLEGDARENCLWSSHWHGRYMKTWNIN